MPEAMPWLKALTAASVAKAHQRRLEEPLLLGGMQEVRDVY